MARIAGVSPPSIRQVEAGGGQLGTVSSVIAALGLVWGWPESVTLHPGQSLAGFGFKRVVLTPQPREAGADMVFVDGVKTIEQARAIGASVKGPKVLSVVDGLETSKLTREDFSEMGFGLVFYALTTLFAATKAMSEVLSHLRHAGETAGVAERLISYGDFQALVDLDRYSAFEHRFDHTINHQ